ncbi:NAD(P)/FAD-dependent oxidoreductase [Mycolicibacterium sp. P1-18]|uniref:NAD(P)/FAD-dependent oxidoreductase n=1 Tax=Mycolicibacterium sp. P1-18 TaxID=2024615 RepID=UPI0011F366FC|nr:FAD/NAD(P)-binding oxidoreductase [Mycolicibacterium sp. P1-18]KAA0090876.1 NAD(P)/FAD-dependent oxidoreductase [Mycolicibacterium sp. P1-18]
MASPIGNDDASFDVVIIGGGNAGISAAARLLKKGVSDVAVVEPQSVHTYRPLLSYVGGGQADMRSAERTQRSVTPRGCTWVRDSAVAVDAGERTVRCASGRTLRYRDVILAPGLVPDTDELPGVDAAMEHPAVASNYLDAAEKTWELVQRIPVGGHAIFTVPRPPVSCTGTTVKPLFLAAAHWQRTGRLPGVQMTLVVDRPTLLDAPALDAKIREELRVLGVRVLYDTAVTGLFPEDRHVTVTSRRDGTVRPISYDLLHLVPPFRGPRWLAESGLAAENSAGVADVDPSTLRHRRHPDVWAVGDGASVDTDPSGGALRPQVSIMVDNLLAARRGHAEAAPYDGYTVAPITTDTRHLVTGEFTRDGALASSLPSFLDPLKPRRTAWAFDRYGLPQIYWNLLLRGRL